MRVSRQSELGLEFPFQSPEWAALQPVILPHTTTTNIQAKVLRGWRGWVRGGREHTELTVGPRRALSEGGDQRLSPPSTDIHDLRGQVSKHLAHSKSCPGLKITA